MIIEYINKEVTPIEQYPIKGIVYSYEVEKEDTVLVKEFQDKSIEEALEGLKEDPSIRIVLNKKGTNIYEMLFDDIEGNRLLVTAKREEKYYINQYIIEEGKEEFISILLSKG